jgi:hypothetical protein
LMTISNLDEEEAPIPNNTSPQTCKGNIWFLTIFQFLNVFFLFRAYAPGQKKTIFANVIPIFILGQFALVNLWK